MPTLQVAYVLETLAAQEGLTLVTDGIDDTCSGFVISSDKTFAQIIRENSAPYNYQIIDGDPIRLVRRAVNDALVIDAEIAETDCIRRGNSPVISLSRVEPSSLPRQVEIQYIDPARHYATTTQVARHSSAPRSNSQISVTLDFVISAQKARDIAFDLLYRLWAQQLSLQFEHPDLRIEPGDVVQVTANQGVFTCIVSAQTINMPARTNTISATILLASKGLTIAAPEADSFTPTSVAILTEDGQDWLTEDSILISTEG